MKEVVVMIVKYLRKDLESGNLSPDAAEGVEVAVQCIESAYGITEEDLRSSEACLENYIPQHSEGGAPIVSEAQKEEAESLKLVGNNLMKEGKFEDAVQHYTRAIELDSQNAVYFCNRAAAYIKLTNYGAAINDCNEAIKIDPQYGKAYSRLGNAYGAMGNNEKAKECYKKALELVPDSEIYKASFQHLEEQCAGSSATNYMPGVTPGTNFADMLRDPSFFNIASQILTEPGTQDAVRRFLVGQSYPMRNVEDLLSIGQEIASRLQQDSGVRREAPANPGNGDGGMPPANPNGQPAAAPVMGQRVNADPAQEAGQGDGDVPPLEDPEDQNEAHSNYYAGGDTVPHPEPAVTPEHTPSASGDA